MLVDRWCFDAHRATDENHAGVKDLEWLMLCAQKHQLKLLSGSRGFGWFLAIAFVEAIDASRGIDQLLFAGEERVASRANFDVQVALLGRAGLECLAASAGNGYIDVFWVNSWFHLILCHSL